MVARQSDYQFNPVLDRGGQIGSHSMLNSGIQLHHVLLEGESNIRSARAAGTVQTRYRISGHGQLK